MTDAIQQIVDNAPQTQQPEKAKPTPIGRLAFAEVDKALSECEKTIKTHSDTVKSKLAVNAAIPGNVLRELSRANAQKAKLVMRRIGLLMESGDQAALDMIDKLVKLKIAK
ncbi:hypothetical protein GJ698_06420 [Pseudoduganella sp. FT26W]|uniref:Uncharacterized protein n=1 Tax=Duganella aquatilis TaxID=2666082 RepID=A0A844CSJ8_9BURK|nr:hypothetical protein [Duganella aquatilis]MRW83727.1 hypothetical protein [Duganella aquatilis]